jgi:Single-stranded DNA-specific exonuclease
VAALGSSLNLPEPVARLLVMRGYADDDSAKRFLRPRLDHLHDALLLKGAEKAVERLAEACEKGETVMIHGDYDVDGICSTTIMTRVLRQFGANAIPFIPRRIEDGYDLSSAGVNAALEAHANVVLPAMRDERR